MLADRAIAHASPLEVDAKQPARQPEGRFLLLGLLALLIFGPLAFGAVEPWAVVIQELGAATLAAFWFSSSRQKLPASCVPLLWPWAALAGVVTLQILLHAAVYIHGTIAAGLQAAAYFLIFLVAAGTLAEAENRKAFGRTLAIFGTLLAFWSVLQGFASPTKLYGLRATRAGGIVYGPYVNHSHYAGLMEMLAPFALVLAFRKNLSRQVRIQWGLAGLLMAASIFLSESRGGMVAFAAEFVVFAIILIQQHSKNRAATTLVAAMAFFTIFIFWMGAGELEARLATFRHPGVSIHTRFQIAQDTLQMWRSHPWLGFGLGNFTRAYPQFRSFYTDELVNAAHNDYLQFLSELGILGFGAILWFLLAVLGRGLRNVHDWSSSSSHSARLAALLGVVGIAVHSLTDFNLQIPANAALFFALCAVASSDIENTPSSRRGRSLPSRPARIALALYAVFCLQLFVGAHFSRSSSAGRLRLATRLDPLNSAAWMKLGHLEYFLEQQPALAAQDLHRAVTLDPLQALAWLELASVEQGLGDHESQIAALQRAYAADPTTPMYLLAEANSYFSAGEPSLAFRRLRDVSTHHRDSLAPALDLAWRATRDPDLILREVTGGDPQAQMALLRFLSALGEEQAAGRVWRALQQNGVAFDPALAVPYVQLLLDNDRADEALAAWQILTARPGMAGYQISQNLLANAGFEADILNSGLDWHYQPRPSVSVNVSTESPHGGQRALCLSFDGPVSDTGLSHYLALPSPSTFELRGFYRATDLRGAGGLAWSLRDLASDADVTLRDDGMLEHSSDWRPFRAGFSTAQQSVLLLSLKRIPAGDILRGQLCLDDLSLTKK